MQPVPLRTFPCSWLSWHGSVLPSPVLDGPAAKGYVEDQAKQVEGCRYEEGIPPASPEILGGQEQITMVSPFPLSPRSDHPTTATQFTGIKLISILCLLLVPTTEELCSTRHMPDLLLWSCISCLGIFGNIVYCAEFRKLSCLAQSFPLTPLPQPSPHL